MSDLGPFADKIPSSLIEQTERRFGPVRVYHTKGGWPLVIVPGTVPGSGRVFGAVVYYRAADDSMNMQIECLIGQVTGVLNFCVDHQMANTKPIDTPDGLRTRFYNNLLRTLGKDKTWRDAAGNAISLDVAANDGQKKEEREEKGEEEREEEDEEEREKEQKRPPAKKQKKDEEEEEEKAVKAQVCMVCLDAQADTLVLPCMHSVVCRVCSTGLRNTNDANICIQCRQPISSIEMDDQLN